MPNNVAITIDVIDNDSAAKVGQVAANLEALGPAGQSGGAAAGAGLDQVGEHAVTTREKVRLLNEELHLGVPLAMQSVIANSQMMTAAIGAIAPAMIAIGGADILMHIGESAYAAYQKYILLKDVIEDSNAVIKSFGDSAEAAMNRASDATERYVRLTQGAAAADAYKLNRYESTPIGISQYQSDQFKKLPDAVKGDFEKITGESVMPKDLDAAIEKLQTYENSAQHTLSYLKQLHDNPLMPDPYSNEKTNASSQEVTQQQLRVDTGAQVIADLKAQQEAYTAYVKDSHAQMDADNKAKADAEIEKAKEKNEAILALETSARNAQLSGEALLEAQREEAIDGFVRRYGQSRAAVEAIDDDYLAKVLALYKREDEEADKKNAKIVSAQQQFNKEMDQVGTHADDQQTEGYARIADMAAQQIKKIQDDWAGVEKTVGDVSAAGVDDQLLAADRIMQVNQNADREREQLHAKTMEEITKEEEQAARMGLAPWQQAEAAIRDEYDDRVRKIQEDVRINVMTEQEGAQAVAAAWATANAQMQRSEEETRDKIASGLQSMFSHPEQFFEKRAMDTAFQMMANEMLSVFKSSSPAGGILQYMFGMGPQMSTSTNPLSAMESALGMGGHGQAGVSSAATSPGMVQFQQGSTTLLTASQMLQSAASTLQSAAGTMTTSGGLGIGGSGVGGLGAAGTSLLGTGGAAVSTASGAGAGVNMSAGLSGLAGASSGLSTLGTFGNALAPPGMSGTSSLNGDAAATESLDSGGLLNPLTGAMPGATNGVSALSAGMGIASGGLMGATSIFSAYQNSNPLAGAMGGAMGGMETGAALGSIVPGLGTVVGGAIGAIAGGIGGLLAGIFGDRGRSQAESLDVNQIQPALAKDVQDFEAGRSGYNSVAPALNAMLISAQNATMSMGSGARSYFNSNISPEINKVLSSLQQQEIGGRSQITVTAGQYHSGGWTSNFGDLATSDTEGFIHAMQNEFVVNPMAAATHAPILQAMNNGTNFAYSNSVQPRMPASPAGGSGVQLTIQALDSKSVAQWAKAGGGLALMAALNQAQRQYSGVGRG